MEKVKVTFEISKDAISGMMLLMGASKSTEDVMKHVKEDNEISFEDVEKMGDGFEKIPLLITMALVAAISKKHNI